MRYFVMATRMSSEAVTAPHDLEELEQRAMAKIREQCPEVEWVQSFAVLGPYDYIDVFKAADIEQAQKVSMLIRTFGRAHSELWPATEWRRFKETIESLPKE